MHRLDLLLVAAVVLSPMNALRIGLVGPSEILLLLWCAAACLNARYPLIVGAIGKAWIAFFIILVASTLHGLIVTPESTAPGGLAVWAFLGVTCVVTFAVVKGRTRVQAERLLTTVGTAATVWFGALYVYSRLVGSTFLGAPLWYGNGLRFSGGADNPHQLAVLLAPCIFINLRALVLAHTLRRRLWHLGLTVVALLLGFETSSSTLILAVMVTGAVTVFYIVLDRMSSRSARTAFTVLIVMFVVIFSALQWRRLVGLVELFLDNDANGWGRLTLWATFNDILDHVLVLGLGPGTHANQGQMEFHNSYLELVAMLGLPAAALALLVMALGLHRLSKQWTLLAIMLPLFAYALPGFAFRRPVFWIIFAICLAIATIVGRPPTDNSDDHSFETTRSGLPAR